ncbi:MAG: T9SS type A sorting domain-containing protein, partial [Bacteroidota bacterium]
SVNSGTPVQLGIVEDNVGFTITQPGGAISNGDLDLGNITLAQAGLYTFDSEEGCSGSLQIIVIDSCAPENFTPTYTIDGITDSGASEITVDEGSQLSLALAQTSIGFSIELPIGSSENGPLELGAISLDQAGNYIFRSENGCESTLTINVIESNDPCPPGSFTPEYTVDNVTNSGSTSITVIEGAQVSLGIAQNGVNFTIAQPDETVSTGALDLGNISMEQAGSYVFESENGCSAEITINVQAQDSEPSIVLKNIVIYPNPVRDGNVTFVLRDFMNETIYVSFYDIYGKLVLRELIPSDHEEEVRLDVGTLSGGTYIVQIARTKKDENTIKKVIKLQ